MVFIWGSGWGPRRRRGFGPGYGYGPPPGYYRRGYGGGGGSCLRDLFFVETGCCLAELLGCGPQLFLLAPAAVRAVRAGRRGGRRPVDVLIAAVRTYQREISPRRAPCCRFSPTCSAYAIAALQRHGAWRGSWLALRRLLRCRPGAAGGPDPVPEV
jgi:putative membrane protein insertion efficiency factor